MNPRKEGQRVPEVTFKEFKVGEGWKTFTTKDIFDGCTVALFSLPGAFTPTCSSSHVPRYEDLADALYAKGVDKIVCVSVNDTFVMNAWAEDQDIEEVRFIADGNGTFTEGMGLLVDKGDIGFGPRSWRYSMLVKDGVIDKMFIEPEVPGDPYGVSDADTMLKYLGGEPPVDVVIFQKPGCPHCARAKEALFNAQIGYDELPVNPRILKAIPGGGTTPQIFINGEHIGGADALEAWLKTR
ncbi:glutathione peroxidase [Myxococcota bacterium]|nr:glutathione peroxidase [Myxococcota bacterium]